MENLMGMSQQALMRLLQGAGSAPPPVPAAVIQPGLPAPGGYDAPVRIEGAMGMPAPPTRDRPIAAPIAAPRPAFQPLGRQRSEPM